MEKFVIVAVIDDLMLQVTSDGTKEGTVFQGMKADIMRAETAADNHELILMGEPGEAPKIYAGYDHPVRLAASLFAISPQNTYLTKAPQQVWDFMDKFPSKKKRYRDRAS